MAKATVLFTASFPKHGGADGVAVCAVVPAACTVSKALILVYMAVAGAAFGWMGDSTPPRLLLPAISSFRGAPPVCCWRVRQMPIELPPPPASACPRRSNSFFNTRLPTATFTASMSSSVPKEINNSKFFRGMPLIGAL